MRARHASRHALVLGAPLAALAAGMAAEWLDFRGLRVPLLLMVGVGVVATTSAVAGGRTGWRGFFIAVVTGIVTWALAQGVYSLIHVARGERFDAEQFGPQWLQAPALIAAHGIFLGLPTGVAAGAIVRVGAWARARTR